MYFDHTQQTFQKIAASLVRIGDGVTRVWPEIQPCGAIADPRIQGTRFLDAATFNARAAQRILLAAVTHDPNYNGYGGKKIRDSRTWCEPELTLLTWRALSFVCVAHGATVAHVVDRWANVMEHDEHSGPHCHFESDLAVVYSLDPGDVDRETPTGGRLQIIDSRIPFCCTSRAERPTRGIYPEMTPGTMIVFPAEFLHSVTPYKGRRPRITLAWNISFGPPPAVGLPDPTLPSLGLIGRTFGV